MNKLKTIIFAQYGLYYYCSILLLQPLQPRSDISQTVPESQKAANHGCFYCQSENRIILD